MGRMIKYPIVDGRKECAACGKWLDISMFNKARKHLTSRCRDCLNVYAAKYRTRSDVLEKSAEYHKEYMRDAANRNRKNQYSKTRNKRPDVKEKRNANRKLWALIQKQKAVDYKGGYCVICGYNSCLAAMDFHHINPLEKEGLRDYSTFDKNKSELDKCILVCCRCHRELHSGVIHYEKA